jgi:hypothetical protein
LKKLFTYAIFAVPLLLALSAKNSVQLDLRLPGSHRPSAATVSGPNAHATSPEIESSKARPSAPLRQTPANKFVIPVAIETDLDLQSEEIEHAVEKIAPADVPAALAALGVQTGPAATEMRQLLVRRWAERDVAAAAAWTMQLPEGAPRQQVIEQVAIAWAETDLDDATAWLRDLPDGEGKQTATLSIAYEAARTDPIAALELASKLLASPERDELLIHAVSQWATTDFATAAAWAGQIPDADLRQNLLSSIAVAASAENASAAAGFIVSSLAPGETQTRAAVSITQRWTQSAPQDAAAWIAQFPDLPVRDAAVENLVGLWARQDSPATANWLSALPSGSLRTTAINVFAANQSQFSATP